MSQQPTNIASPDTSGAAAARAGAAAVTTFDAPCGGLRGVAEDGTVVFRGVPYGTAERFRRPTALPRWGAVRDAAAFGPAAVQAPNAGGGDVVPPDIADWFGGPGASVGLTPPPQSEACLFLNVTTPAVGAGARPVLVYIHGGGFSGGHGNLGMSPVLAREQEVVLVSMNHRLNVFGFLHLASVTESFPDAGNAGMLDLVLALEWVRDNIAAFGGDPMNVTLVGESGGGAKISTLMAMPEAAGLFHRAVIQSGSLVNALTPEQAAVGAQRLLQTLGGVTVNDLLALSAEELWRAATEAGVPFVPVVDGRTLPRHPFSPDAPDQSARVGLLVGHCLDESSMFAPSVDEAKLRSRYGISEEHLATLIAAYRATYPTVDDARLRVRIASDATFTSSVWQQLDRKAAQPPPVYRYVFTYEPPVMAGILGAFHTAELPLVFRRVSVPETEELSKRLSAAWAAFARTGDPSTAELPWPAYDVDRRRAMRFDLDPQVVSDPDSAIRAAWGEQPTPGLVGLLTELRA